jgi:protein-S-isoprenylcysteine O-methyltransferase Ste14
MAQVTCSVCNREMTVSEGAPRNLACPHCHATFLNPDYVDVDFQGPEIPMARQVARQVTRDTRGGSIAIAALVVLLFLATILSFSKRDPTPGLITVFLMALVVAALAVGIAFDRARSKRFVPTHVPQRPASDSRVLDYQSAPMYRTQTGGAVGVGLQVTLGIIGGIVITIVAIVMALREQSKETWPIYAIIGSEICIGITLMCMRRFRGYGAGLLLTPALLFLVFYAICG